MANFLYTLIIYPLYLLIECIYVFFNKVTYNPGISVIGVSVGITLLCLPLYAVAEKWQEIERNKEKAMEGQLKRIKETFTGDERYMMTTAYYKECHYSPMMSLRSSFGLLIQIPFFMAAYSFLSSRCSGSFLFIKNMGVPDRILTVGGFGINILPIAMTLINIIAGAIYTKGFKFKDKITIYGMALVFLVILYDSPSGLVLYWTMNNVFSLVKNIFYKLKNPLKTFFISCGILLIPATAFVFAKAHTKLANKLLFLVIVLFFYAVPFVIKLIKNLLDGKLSYLVENKKSRHTVFMLACLLLAIVTGLVIPGNLIASSPVEFADLGSHGNPQFYINNVFVIASGIFIFWAFCIYFLFGKRIQTVFAVLMVILAFSSLLNCYAFMMNYGDISNGLKFLHCSDFGGKSPASLLNLLLLAVILVLTVLFIKKGKIFSYIMGFVAFAELILGITNVVKINSEYSDYSKNFATSQAGKIEPLFTLSKNHPNVVYLYLDMAQGQFVSEQVKEWPELLEKFEGFTYYGNVLSYNGHTIMGSPGCYGGYEYTPAEMNKRDTVPLVEKHNQALLMMPRIFNEQAGFSAVMTDPSWPNHQQFCDLSFVEPFPQIKAYKTCGTYYALWAKKYMEETGLSLPDNSEKILKRNMIFYSIFRQSPIILRKLIYKNGNYWNTDDSAENGKAALDNYSALDFLKEFTKIEDTENGSYVAFVNQLTHENDTMLFEAPEYIPSPNVVNLGTSKFKNDIGYHTQMASFKLIAKWLDYLRENDIYDNTRIVIVSDHGGTSTEDDFEYAPELDAAITGGQYFGRGHYHCLLMYKDFYATSPMKLDFETFMTNADTPSLLLTGVVDNPVNPFTEKAIPADTTQLKKDGVYITACDEHQPSNNGRYTFSIKPEQWWLVKDNIFKASNWTQESPFEN